MRGRLPLSVVFAGDHCGPSAEMAREVTVALCQVTGEPFDPKGNRRLAGDFARRAFERGADVVVLPEMIIPGYSADAERLAPLAEPIDGPAVTEWHRIAAASGGYIAGGFCESDGDERFNSAVVVGPDGIALHYRKLHLFDREKKAFQPGDLGLPVAELGFGTVGLCVCYDLRFVETARALALQGAELILVPTAWLTGFDQVRWRDDGLAPQAEGAVLQANLNQAFIACASQAGERGGRFFLGSSVLVGPRGELLLGPLSGTSDELALATIDLADAERAQRRSELITPRADRRTDVYGLVVGDRRL
ncbi:MAG: nitrilase/cyanide hydratase protein [Solirubrobacterales bacterium]|nr:nitrilase/cyanide hydratase protein [Solirubrobacterales bacterium]